MVSDQTVKNLAETFERTKGNLADRLVAALKAGQAGGGDKRGMQSAALLVVRKNGGYLGANDRFIDIRVYDAPDPIAELERLLALHKLHFFPSEPQDLIPITPDIVAQAGADPPVRAGQSEGEVAHPEAGHRQPAVPRGAQELHVLGELRRAGADGREDRQGRAGRHSEEEVALGHRRRSSSPGSSGPRHPLLRPSEGAADALLHRDVGALQLLRDAGAAHPLHDRARSPRAGSPSTRPRPAPSTAPTSPWCTSPRCRAAGSPTGFSASGGRRSTAASSSCWGTSASRSLRSRPSTPGWAWSRSGPACSSPTSARWWASCIPRRTSGATRGSRSTTWGSTRAPSSRPWSAAGSRRASSSAGSSPRPGSRPRARGTGASRWRPSGCSSACCSSWPAGSTWAPPACIPRRRSRRSRRRRSGACCDWDWPRSWAAPCSSGCSPPRASCGSPPRA